MRAMGVQLLPEEPLVPVVVPDGRATAWTAGTGGSVVVRARFHDAAAELVTHDLELVVSAGDLGADDRRRLLLVGSREADLHTFATRLRSEGWREVARSTQGHSTGTGYFLALVDHRSGH